MKTGLLIIAGLLAAAVTHAADRIAVTLTNTLDAPRPAETIVIPFQDIRRLLPTARFDNLDVRDAAGQAVPAQVTNLDPKGGRNYNYDDLIFQHDFTAGEKTAVFTITAVAGVVPPFPPKVNARFVPDRLDDFAWENDRIAHRLYGPALETPAAGPDRMPIGGSGIDVWSKRFPYFVIDRWYGKGHDPLHTDAGEGLDMYETGQSRGDGGTGIWDGKALHVSHDFRTWKVLANGPIRAVFELGYEPWDAGNGIMVAETKRFTVDAGSNFDEAESTFTITAGNTSAELTVGVGLTLHNGRADNARTTPAQNDKQFWESLWEVYPQNGAMGTAVLLAPTADFAGFAESTVNVPAPGGTLRPDALILAKVKSGAPLRYYIGAAWDQTGQFKSNDEWTAYLENKAQRLRAPITVSMTLAPAK